MWKASNLQDFIFGSGRNFSPIEEYVILWFYHHHFLKKQILQVLRIETVGFLSQNYITLHNNLVNMIFLSRYFPTSISVCIWNKLYASFYLKKCFDHVTSFEKLNKVWFQRMHHGIVGSLSLILVIKIIFIQTPVSREMRVVLHKPPLKRKEL